MKNFENGLFNNKQSTLRIYKLKINYTLWFNLNPTTTQIRLPFVVQVYTIFYTINFVDVNSLKGTNR